MVIFVPLEVVFSVEVWVLVLFNVEVVAMGVVVLPSDEVLVETVVEMIVVVV